MDKLETLARFLEVRTKHRARKTRKVGLQYHRWRSACARDFDYLVQMRARKYRRFSNHEDLVQDGRIALLLALESFDPNKGNFFWWADQYIKTKLSREANKHSVLRIPIKTARTIQPQKLDWPTGENQLLETEAGRMMSTPDPADMVAHRKEVSTAVRAAVKDLPKLQRDVLELNRFHLYPLNKISKMLGISAALCSRTFHEAEGALRTSLSELHQEL